MYKFEQIRYSGIEGRNRGRAPSPKTPSEKDDPSPKPPSETDGVAMLRRKDDFTYSPRILAKKMGVSKETVKRHLKKTGLIKQCCGRWVGRFFAR